LPVYSGLQTELTAGIADLNNRIAADTANPKSVEDLRQDSLVADGLRQSADRAAKLSNVENAIVDPINAINNIIADTGPGRTGAKVGDGSSEAAAKQEARTGVQVEKKWHGPKCREESAGLAKQIDKLENLRSLTSNRTTLATIDDALERAGERKKGLDTGAKAWEKSPYKHLAP